MKILPPLGERQKVAVSHKDFFLKVELNHKTTTKELVNEIKASATNVWTLRDSTVQHHGLSC